MGYAILSDESASTLAGSSRSSRPMAAVSTKRAANVLVDMLVEAGVEVVFGLPGGAIAPFHDALLDRPEIRMITTRQEAGAVFAAAGYARATGKLGVVAVTSGPGILNALTGIASAHCDGLPLLVLAGEVPRGRYGKGAFQEGSTYELDIVGATRSLTKMSAELREPNAATALLQHAMATALSGRRGPVLLTLPVDVATADVRRPLLDLTPRVAFESDSSSVRAAAEALASTSSGVLLVGSGARWGSGPRRVMELAERLQLPVMTTPKAKGVFPESHPLSLGVFGWGGHPSTTRYLEEGVDVFMAIGTSLGEVATDNWSPLIRGRQHFIHLDAEPLVIGRTYPATIGLVGTAERILPELLVAIGPQEREPRSFGVVRLNSGADVLRGTENRLAPQRAIWELQQSMPARTLYSSDIGEHMLFAIHHLEIDTPESFTLMSGLGSMGSGIGAALGMKVAHPDRPVVAICGDGCFAMALADVATAVQERLPIVIAVMNDERYGMVEIGNGVVYGRSPTYSWSTVNIPDLALGMGAQAIVIRRPDEILTLNLPAMTMRGPVVLDIRTDRSIQLSRARLDFLKKSQSELRLKKN
ncbi:MAG: Acetolactate synthase large subunit protein [Labilithrix sp.]|nr:Acetolactate synthase large subunit protein [Labilithrix sp.]